jgi:soluble lytic murein transglycosylase-like protein
LLAGPLGVSLLCAADPAVERVRSDVRADKRSGRLVRSVVIEPVLVGGKPVPKTPEPYAPAARPSVPLAASARINAIIDDAARQFDVDPLLVHALIQVESAYNPHAVSSAGAQGLMQLMPDTARQLGVRNSFDVEENIRAGVKHLKELQETYRDDRLALAAYNAGAGAVNKYGWIPPYRETQEYVYKVGKKYGEARKAAAVQLAASKPETPAAKAEKAAEAAETQATRQVESFVDDQGRLHMRTK